MRSVDESEHPPLESEELFRFALEISRMGVWELCLKDHTARRTLEHDRIFGYESLLPTWTYETFLEHVLREDRVHVESNFKRAVENGTDWDFECRIRRADGKVRWIWAAGRHKTTEAGVRVIAGIVQDITTQKDAQLRLVESQRRLQAIMDAAPIGLSYSDDTSCERITGNHALFSQFEIQAGDNISASAADPSAAGRQVHLYREGHELADRELPLQKAVAERQRIGPVELEILLPSGRRWFAEAYGAPVLDDKGEAIGGVAVTVDITERRAIEEAIRKSETALRKSEALLNQALDAADAGVWESVPETGEFRASDRALALHGLPPGTQMTHELALAAVHPDDRQRIEAAVNFSVLTGAPLRVELRAMQPDGSTKWLSSMAEARKENDKIRLVGLVQDITERKRIEESLVEQQQRLSLALSAGRLATWDWDLTNDKAIWNDEHFTLLGYRTGEVKPGYEAWAARLHPEDKARIEANFGKALKQGGEYSAQYRVIAPDGSIRWIEARGRMEREQDRTVRSYGVLIDTTERKRAEEALRDADRRKDEFLATLAHELRNPLAPIRNAVYVLRRLNKADPGAQDKAQSLLGMVERQVDHLVRLVDDLLEVARITTGKIVLKKEPVDLLEIFHQALQTSEPHIQAQRHKLHFASDAERLMVEGDPVRLAQVFTNILNNAAKYTPAGGNITVGMRREGEEAIVTVKDDGIGILPEMLPKIFDLFVQSRRVTGRERGGIGVGLALARRLVEMHGGQLEGRSDGPDRGSEFVVKLPLTRLSGQKVEPRADLANAANTGRQRALIVDDDKDVADSFAILLEHFGAQTRVVYDGEAALQAVEDFRPELVFIDLGMPHMDGFATAQSIKRQPHGADVKLIALTGWGQSEDRARTRDAGFDLHMTKPVCAEEVKAVLNGAMNFNHTKNAVEN